MIEPAEEESDVNKITHRLAAASACLAIAAAAATTAGCGSNDVNKAVDKAQKKGDKALSTVQQAAKDAKKALPKDAQKKINQAGNTADQAVGTVKDKAGAAVDAATNADKSNSKNGKGGGY
jgi:hypothetical protein